MIDQSTLVSAVSSAITGIVVIVANIVVNKNNVTHLKESLSEFKINIKEIIHTEKSHALELGKARIVAVEKDVQEIFPRLRTAEDAGQKNCIVLTKLLQEHEKMMCRKP